MVAEQWRQTWLQLNEEEGQERRREGEREGRNAWNDGIQFVAGGESERRWLAEEGGDDINIYYDNKVFASLPVEVSLRGLSESYFLYCF